MYIYIYIYIYIIYIQNVSYLVEIFHVFAETYHVYAHTGCGQYELSPHLSNLNKFLQHTVSSWVYSK